MSPTFCSAVRGTLLGGLAAAVFLFGMAACGGGGSSSSRPRPTPVASPAAVTNSSVFAVDCVTDRAYVPLPFLSTNLTGEVGVENLAVNPDETDPRTATIDLGLTARPRAATAIMSLGEVLVLTDPVTSTGFLQIIAESDNSLTNISFPTGSSAASTDGVVYDPNNNTALVSMSTVPLTCTGNCTGVSVFDVASQTFGPLLNLANPVDNFGLDSAAGVPMASSDPITPNLYAPDISVPAACQFSDGNLTDLDADPEGVAVDPTTHIWVVGNFLSPQATVLNLNGATYSPGINCMLNEAGTPPNSVNHESSASENMSGVAINPVTHEALLTAESAEEVTLLTLPSNPVEQLTEADVESVTSSIPDDPSGNPFVASTAPYAVVMDSCHNRGYVLDNDRDFLVQIDLDLLKNHPDEIAKPLKSGHCAGTTTPFACTNGHGITYFPLPGVN